MQIPADKEAHFQAVQGAYTQKDWALVRTLGHEYVVRYPGDDRADDVQYLLGDADLQDNRPTSALGEFNRILKQYPKMRGILFRPTHRRGKGQGDHRSSRSR